MADLFGAVRTKDSSKKQVASDLLHLQKMSNIKKAPVDNQTLTKLCMKSFQMSQDALGNILFSQTQYQQKIK